MIALNPYAPVEEFVGDWRHSAEMNAKLPVAVREFGLWPPFRDRTLGPDDWGKTVVVTP